MWVSGNAPRQRCLPCPLLFPAPAFQDLVFCRPGSCYLRTIPVPPSQLQECGTGPCAERQQALAQHRALLNNDAQSCGQCYENPQERQDRCFCHPSVQVTWKLGRSNRPTLEARACGGGMWVQHKLRIQTPARTSPLLIILMVRLD